MWLFFYIFFHAYFSSEWPLAFLTPTISLIDELVANRNLIFQDNNQRHVLFFFRSYEQSILDLKQT